MKKTLFGKELSETDKKSRIKIYLLEAFIVSVVMLVIDIISTLGIKNYGILHIFQNQMLNYIFTFSFNCCLVFIMVFCLDFLLSERRFRK